jgi:hypothetical protein
MGMNTTIRKISVDGPVAGYDYNPETGIFKVAVHSNAKDGAIIEICMVVANTFWLRQKKVVLADCCWKTYVDCDICDDEATFVITDINGVAIDDYNFGAGSCVTVEDINGCSLKLRDPNEQPQRPPYTWEIVSADDGITKWHWYNLAGPQEGETNDYDEVIKIYNENGTCGSAVIRVTDICGDYTEGTLRADNGVWSLVLDIGDTDGSHVSECIINGQKYVDDWCTDPPGPVTCEENCGGGPYAEHCAPKIGAYCWVEGYLLYDWVCE